MSRKKSLTSFAHESNALPKSQRRRKRRTPVPIASRLAIPSDDGSGTVEVLPKADASVERRASRDEAMVDGKVDRIPQ